MDHIMQLKVIGVLVTLFSSCVLFTSAFQDCDGDQSVRLQGGRSDRHGRVEVCRNGEWNTMCAQKFNSVDATIVCRELGFSDKGAKPVNSGFSRGYSTQTVWLMDTLCNGTEESILDCPTQGFGGYQRQLCTHNSDVGVTCRAPEMGELRILGGMNTSAGRLEVFNHKEWGTICDDYWSAMDAEVACRQLGFSTYGARAVRNGFRKRSKRDPTPIWLDNLQCTGTEDRLVDCTNRTHNCDHTEDSGIVCRQFNDDIIDVFLRGLMLAQMETENSKVTGELEGENQSLNHDESKDEISQEMLKNFEMLFEKK